MIKNNLIIETSNDNEAIVKLSPAELRKIRMEKFSSISTIQKKEEVKEEVKEEKLENTNDYTYQLNLIKSERENKFREKNIIKPKEIIPYNYENRKRWLNKLRFNANSKEVRENMDKVEKQEYQTNMSIIVKEDIDHIKENDFQLNFIVELFKYNYNFDILNYAYKIWTQRNNHIHFLMLSELIKKPKLKEDLLMTYLLDFTEHTKNMNSLIMNTQILKLKFNTAINYILDIFYSEENSYYISFDELLYMFNNSEVTPDKFIFLLKRCSNKLATTKCTKTFTERSNTKILITLKQKLENKFKCRFDVDFYN